MYTLCNYNYEKYNYNYENCIISLSDDLSSLLKDDILFGRKGNHYIITIDNRGVRTIISFILS